MKSFKEYFLTEKKLTSLKTVEKLIKSKIKEIAISHCNDRVTYKSIRKYFS